MCVCACMYTCVSWCLCVCLGGGERSKDKKTEISLTDCKVHWEREKGLFMETGDKIEEIEKNI